MKMPMMKKAAAAPSSVNDLLGTVDACRDQIAALRDDRAAVEAAPRPLAETLESLDAELDRIATASVDTLRPHHLRERNTPISMNLTLGLLVALNREAFRQIVADQIADLEHARPGLTEADRLARLCLSRSGR